MLIECSRPKPQRKGAKNAKVAKENQKDTVKKPRARQYPIIGFRYDLALLSCLSLRSLVRQAKPG
jgi:hypothetical protein